MLMGMVTDGELPFRFIDDLQALNAFWILLFSIMSVGIS